jgi:hypothetical protein
MLLESWKARMPEASQHPSLLAFQRLSLGAETSLIPPSPGHVRVTVEFRLGYERVNRTGETSITLTAETP